ncbi:hypothetical protein FACS1894172_04390 [Spirochaetia bacterium]|nr:hypothetical protein FACS1894164_18060 [Spirochaetia bacterium]GHU30691.1 hypothetical protein FACS1894172_04390 [Spirochaetia bacterium]
MKYNHSDIFLLFLIVLLISCKNTLKQEIVPEMLVASVMLAEAEPAPEEITELATEEEPVEDVALIPLNADLPVLTFPEVWGYVIDGQENALKGTMPVSDVGYFGGTVSTYGALTGVPDRKKLSYFPGRVHLVVTCNGQALTHFSLTEGAVRNQLIMDLLKAAGTYDGLQIDFENVPGRDRESFLSFLRELRAGLGEKMLTVALPARTRTISDDMYHYPSIAGIVDRILVMAYDEHWSGSAPGPIASMAWCKRVADYALGVLGPEKLIMGLPFYGRAWGRSPNSAYTYSGIERIKAENNVTEIQRENGIPMFSFTMSVTVTAYYEDSYSLIARMQMYQEQGIQGIGFWRIGQEDSRFWQKLSLKK